MREKRHKRREHNYREPTVERFSVEHNDANLSKIQRYTAELIRKA